MRDVCHTTTSIKSITLTDALVNSTHKPKKASHRPSKRKMASSSMDRYMNERCLFKSVLYILKCPQEISSSLISITQNRLHETFVW